MAWILAQLGERELTRYRAEKIGFVFQQFHLVPYLSAVENVMLAQYFHSIADENEAARSARASRPGRPAGACARRSFPAASSSAWRSRAR